MKNVKLFGVLMVLVLLAVPAGVAMAAVPTAPEVSVTLCHATASESNPYREITVSGNAVANNQKWFQNGHGGHSDDIWPAFVLADGTPVSAHGDQSILANGCVVPEPPDEEPFCERYPDDPQCQEPEDPCVENPTAEGCRPPVTQTPPPPPPQTCTVITCQPGQYRAQQWDCDDPQADDPAPIYDGQDWICWVDLCSPQGEQTRVTTQKEADSLIEAGWGSFCPVPPPSEVPPTGEAPSILWDIWMWFLSLLGL